MVTENKKAGKLIRKQRLKYRYSLEKLAEYCELSDRCISDIERGIRVPKADTLLEICRQLNIDSGELKELYIRSDEESY